ncbi:E3 ubiquitin-protein ligase CBL-B-A [Capsaspora owczarzaki ATCC 30864]|uniref:E3 ubiquitin-protein ligase CBL-B-A n=1 Tax=Capsaspora owczarzaki (strain ATCC 30864) TaxID=595528 RepID=A0A0D2WMR8_CAPO3|nr:E3 ubiquitin-protein ligase CBL-B-A [Capsaspora owczarzaki ATCC 30864]KJE92220.1 E3 ubiquitin-protein ligase CBL-B-A [Capsaspora owczarzaki ATCC 30864]|eukprot:XP_004364071.2 E3 ubiquitin-protein ligase CBL-B-A [Capsaspora owczarzaki ATCC 30864]
MHGIGASLRDFGLTLRTNLRRRPASDGGDGSFFVDPNASGSSAAGSPSNGGDASAGSALMNGADYKADAELDSRTLDRLSSRVQKILKLIKSKKLTLRNSPPFLQELLAEIYQHLKLILSKAELETLRQIPYLTITLQNIFLKLYNISSLIKKGKHEDLQQEESHIRRQLTKFTLILSHIVTDFKAVFPNGKFCDKDLKIAKKEAADFWKANFDLRCIVPWHEFLAAFKTVHPISTPQEASALRTTMNLTDYNHISWFEFDVFTRLFQPWSHLVNNWNVLAITHPAYQAYMTYDEVNTVLKPFVNKPGSYVFRLSCTRLGQWAIGYVNAEKKVVQTIPNTKSLYQALIDGSVDGTFKYPMGQDDNPDIQRHVTVTPATHIKVSEEQFEIYSDIESTFELCKICSVNDKNVRINPCGHLLCLACVTHWRSTGSQVCPFCRDQIKDVENVIIEPFKKRSASQNGEEEDDDSDSLPDIDLCMLVASKISRKESHDEDDHASNGSSSSSSAAASSSSSSINRGPVPQPPGLNAQSSAAAATAPSMYATPIRKSAGLTTAAAAASGPPPLPPANSRASPHPFDDRPSNGPMLVPSSPFAQSSPSAGGAPGPALPPRRPGTGSSAEPPAALQSSRGLPPSPGLARASPPLIAPIASRDGAPSLPPRNANASAPPEPDMSLHPSLQQQYSSNSSRDEVPPVPPSRYSSGSVRSSAPRSVPGARGAFDELPPLPTASANRALPPPPPAAAGGRGMAPNPPTTICPMCATDLTGFDNDRVNSHIDRCLRI